MIGEGSTGLGSDRATAEAEWDAFVAATPGGTYHQSSTWAEVKAVMGWESSRLVLRRDGAIVGGCQVLVRRLPVGGKIAYVPRGPIVADRDPGLLDELLASLENLARTERIIFLKVQPPPDRHDVSSVLEARGYVESALEAAPLASTRIDLAAPVESLLRGVNRNTKRNLRKAQQCGIVVREGNEDDLRTVAGLIEATSRRQGFSPYPLRYYEQMWRVFRLHGRACLLIAELDDVALASNLVVGFSDTAIFKMGAWCGVRRDVPPNELLHWTAIEWARNSGYRYYDFDDIDPLVAATFLGGAAVPPEVYRGVTGFKLGFRGEILTFPAAYDYTPKPWLSGALRWLSPNLDRLAPLAQRLLGRSR